MSEQLLDLLKLGLLALLYLFFLRVLWAVATQLRTPALVGSPPARRPGRGRSSTEPGPGARRGRVRGPTQLVAVSPAAFNGLTVQLADNVVFGRAPGCTVVLDDGFVSQHHGRIFRGEAGWYYEDLGSTNGSRHNTERVEAPVLLTVGDHLGLGNITLEAR